MYGFFQHADFILHNADKLAADYVEARKSRFSVLVRQYMGSIFLQVLLHTTLLGTAGWLLSQDELTLGQLVAAEVVIAGLLLNMDSVVKRFYVIYYFFTALVELDHLFSLPKDKTSEGLNFTIPESDPKGLHLKFIELNGERELASPSKKTGFEANSGEKLALVCPTETARHHLAKTLAGLEEHSKSVVSYNGVDLKNL